VTESEAVRRATKALIEARDRVGDDKQAVRTELLEMMDEDPLLHEAMATYALQVLADQQSTRH
jgi:chaperone required for assembly of F1-ATPase